MGCLAVFGHRRIELRHSKRLRGDFRQKTGIFWQKAGNALGGSFYEHKIEQSARGRLEIIEPTNQWAQGRHLARSANQHRAHGQRVQVEAGDGQADGVILINDSGGIEQRR